MGWLAGEAGPAGLAHRGLPRRDLLRAVPLPRVEKLRRTWLKQGEGCGSQHLDNLGLKITLSHQHLGPFKLGNGGFQRSQMIPGHRAENGVWQAYRMGCLWGHVWCPVIRGKLVAPLSHSFVVCKTGDARLPTSPVVRMRRDKCLALINASFSSVFVTVRQNLPGCSVGQGGLMAESLKANPP